MRDYTQSTFWVSSLTFYKKLVWIILINVACVQPKWSLIAPFLLCYCDVAALPRYNGIALFPLNGTVWFGMVWYSSEQCTKIRLAFPPPTILLLDGRGICWMQRYSAAGAHCNGALPLFSPGEKTSLTWTNRNSCAFYEMSEDPIITKAKVTMQGRQKQIVFGWCSDISLPYMFSMYVWQISCLKTLKKLSYWHLR